MTASTATPSYATTFYAGPPPPPTSSTFRPEQQPPQLAYGWWVDVLPPRGPYLWPCNPHDYQITQPIAHTKHEQHNDGSGSSGTDGRMDSTDSSSSPSSSSFLSQPPQMAFGWYCAEPPRSGPFFWSCLPPGYQLVSNKQWEAMTAGVKQSALTTTRQGNVTLTLPTSSASLAATLAAAAAANTPTPPPSSLTAMSDVLSAPSPSLSLSNFYPASKTASISNLFASPTPSLTTNSLSFLNLSQSQDEGLSGGGGSGAPVLPPMPSRSPALEGLAAIAGEERAEGNSEFKLDSVVNGGGGAGSEAVGASLGSVGENDDVDGEEEGEDSQHGVRRGKRKRMAKRR